MIVQQFQFTTSSLKISLWLCYTCLQCHSAMQFQKGKEEQQTFAPLISEASSLSWPILLMESVLTSNYVWGELVAVFASMTANVALKWISISMTTHVNGVHDMVQEKHSTMLTLKGP